MGAILDRDDVTAEAIPDLVHIHPTLFKVLVKTKGLTNVILVTDSIRYALAKGVRASRGAYRFKDGMLAGSYLTMNRAVGNAVGRGGLSIEEAVGLATINPARLLGIDEKKGSLGVGKDADIVIFDKKFDVKLTMIHGEVVYKEKGAA